MDTDARFGWTELSTTDKEKATRFYGRLLGWESIPQPLWTRSGQTIDYSLLALGALKVGGLYPLVGGQRKQGARPQWLSYVFVADAAATSARACELGAALLAGPLDVYDLGRLSILRDPEGSLFGTWQPVRLGNGFQAHDQPGCASWHEHVSEDPARAARFYAALFGWSQRGAAQDGRILLDLGGAPLAACSPRAAQAAKLAPRWLTFFQVSDCDATCQKLAALEGSVLAPPIGAPGSERRAVVSDPQGAAFGLLAPPQRGTVG